MSAARLGGSWLLGIGLGLLTLALVRGNFAGLAFPFLVAAVGFMLLSNSAETPRRFPATEWEGGLDRLFALLLPARKATTTATARLAMADARRLVGLRRGARRWGTELQRIAADGYETASRLAAVSELTGEEHDRALAAEAVSLLRAERAQAGADLNRGGDPVSMLAYGLGARPAGVDLASLDELLFDLGLAEAGDELRSHFDEVVGADIASTSPRLSSDAQRRMFRDLAGASFVLGAAARIVELTSRVAARDTPIPAARTT